MLIIVTGFVKPSRADKDYVFLELSKAPDVFVSGQLMRDFGGLFPTGAMVEAEVLYSPDKGFRATQIIKVTQPHALRPQVWQPATMKWYDTAKGYGFCALDVGEDAFVHGKMLRECGVIMPAVSDGMRVEVRVSPGARGGRLVVNKLRFSETS